MCYSNYVSEAKQIPPIELEKEPKRIFVLGATGTIGQAVVAELVNRGHDVVCFIRPQAGDDNLALPSVELRFGDVTEPMSMEQDGFCGENFDVLLSCLASRTGEPDDAWAIDHDAHLTALSLAKAAGVSHVVLLSAICVQKPRLAFQHAKLAFEKVLTESGIKYSIIRPTAFFKSLSGQVERVKRGKPFMVFGDGTLTACKPISANDLGRFLVDCLDDQERHNRILPIGGPGEAMTPKQQGEMLFALLNRKPTFVRIPIWVLDIIIRILSVVGWIVPWFAQKAELARIGRYYASESMLVWDDVTAQYSDDATPSTGSETLSDHYADLLNENAIHERGEQSVF